MNELKLFVWDDVLADYTQGIVVALAHDVNEARRIVLSSLAEDYQRPMVMSAIEDEPKIYTEPVARVVFGGG